MDDCTAERPGRRARLRSRSILSRRFLDPRWPATTPSVRQQTEWGGGNHGSSFCERWRRQPPTRAPYLRARRGKGPSLAFLRAQKNLDGNLPIERLKSLSHATLPPQIELGSRLAAGAWRGAPTPSRPSAERGGLDGVRRRLPATSASMVICAAGLSLARSAALQALRLPPPHPSPSCAAGSLASVRDPRTARTPRARRPLGLSGTGQRCCSRSHGVLTRRAHTARSYTAYAQLPLICRGA